jgi:hypothetical protein
MSSKSSGGDAQGIAGDFKVAGQGAADLAIQGHLQFLIGIHVQAGACQTRMPGTGRRAPSSMAVPEASIRPGVTGSIASMSSSRDSRAGDQHCLGESRRARGYRARLAGPAQPAPLAGPAVTARPIPAPIALPSSTPSR